MTPPVRSPIMVGRDAELETLREAWQQALTGRPRGVVIRGEAGIGKTRLVQELRSVLEGPAALAQAQCVDLGGLTGTPFTAVRWVLRDLVTAFGAEGVMAGAGALASLLPGPAGPGEDPGPLTAYVEQMYEAMSDLLAALSRERPILVVVEDLQWADAATLALLGSVLRTLREGRVLVVLTYRPEDVGRTHPLRRVLVELDRSREVTWVELGRLSDDLVEEQARLIVGDRLAPDILAGIVERGDGVPFLVEELVSLTGRGQARLPPTLRDVVLARYEQLTKSTQTVLRLLAAGGPDVEHEVLAAVFPGDPAALDSAVEEAVDASVIVAGSGSYAFRHALTREAVQELLLPGERGRVHSRYADVLARRPDAALRLAEISHHWLSANHLPHAFETALAASGHARATLAFQSAARLGERALSLWAQVPGAAEVAGTSLAELTDRVAQDHYDAGDFDRASALWEEAVSSCPPSEVLLRARMLHLRAACEHDLGRPGFEQLMEDGLGLLEHREDEAARSLSSRIRAAMALVLVEHGDLASARALADRATDEALSVGAGPDAARAATYSAYAQTLAGEITDGLAAFDRSEQHDPGNPVTRWRCAYLRAVAELDVGHLTAARATVDRALRIAHDSGLEHTVTGAGTELLPVLLATGDWALAEQRAIELLSRSPAAATWVPPRRSLLWLIVWRDETGRAAAFVDRHRSELVELSGRDGLQAGDTASVLAEAAYARGDLAGAWSEVSAPWARVSHFYPGRGQGLVAVGARVLAALRRRGQGPSPDPEPWLRAELSRVAVGDATRAWSALVDAELSGPDRAGGDVAAWDAAVSALAEGTTPVHLRHYALLRRATAEAGTGDKGSAAQTLAQAIHGAEQLGARLIVRWSQELATSAGLKVAGLNAVGRPASILTAREEQVLRLVTEGLNNREIGERLYISRKTASVHVSAILRKLGVSSRTEAAVATQRLLEPEES